MKFKLLPDPTFCFVTFVAAGMFANGQCLAQTDSITLFSGRPIRGTVEQVTPQSLSVKTTDGVKTIEPWNIKRIRFEKEPRELTTAKSGFADGRYNVCIDELKAMANAPERDVVRQNVDYYLAMASARIALAGGNVSATEAATTINQFVQANAQSFHYIPAVNVLGDLAMALGRFDVASTQFEIVAKSAWPELSLSAKLKNGRALMMQQQYDLAIAEFGKVESDQATEDYALQSKLIATCLRAQALAQSGKPDEALQIATSVIKTEDAQNAELFAHAYNALGAAYQAKNQPKEAVKAYLHTDLLFFTEKSAHAEALFHLYQLWNELDRTDRASAVRLKIKDRYRNTFWANKKELSSNLQ